VGLKKSADGPIVTVRARYVLVKARPDFSGKALVYQELSASSFLFLLLALPRSHSTSLGQVARLKTTRLRRS